MATEVLDLTSDLSALVGLATGEAAVDDLLRRGLEWVSKLAPYDLATVLELEGETLRVRAARGPLARDPVRHHAIELSRFPTIREALETRRARAFTEEDHADGDGDPFDGVLDLPHGHSCMVVPLCAGERRFGVMTLDRSQCVRYPQEVVQLVEVYGQVLALAVFHAEQQLALDRLHEGQRAHARELEDELGGDPFGVLESSQSPSVRDVVRRAKQVATTSTPVLVQGETGTGKERLARAIHLWSERAERSFVTLNCAAIPESLIESELFGHVKGAFTGAQKDRPGRFQIANKGTLLLDEVGELPLPLQAKLLRVLQEGTFEPVGSDRTVKVDVRVIAATHVDLRAAVEAGRFREDLYYRLAVFPLALPPLRERLEDLRGLSAVILREQAKRTGRHNVTVSEAGLDVLRRYVWPGNLRELSNVLERATIVSTGRELGPSAFELHLETPRGRSEPAPTPSPDEEPIVTLEEMEARYIRRVLARTQGKIYGKGGAAELLGLPPSTLQSRMKKLGVERTA
ncbi:MAG: sigma 54-interacting transcriptional regulator [Polyangiales bacterium]